jgi:hypothetical protein
MQLIRRLFSNQNKTEFKLKTMEKSLNVRKLNRAEMKYVMGGTEPKICWTEGERACDLSCRGNDGLGSGYCDERGNCNCDR